MYLDFKTQKLLVKISTLFCLVSGHHHQCLDCLPSTNNSLNKCKESGKQTLIQYDTDL